MTAATGTPEIPSVSQIDAARESIGTLVRETPVLHWRSQTQAELFGADTDVFMKLELFQYTGTFKARGALGNLLDLDDAGRARGVTAVSAGNHAAAVAYAAKCLSVDAKVVMTRNANPARVALCQSYGATVVFADDVHVAFDTGMRIRDEERRTMIHPFEGWLTCLGTATLGVELARQLPDLDAVIVPIGGGGLCAGVATAVKLLQPGCQVFGVEPEGADTMHRSFAAGSPQSIDQVHTIADSLGAPYAAQYSMELCQAHVDELVLIDDAAMKRAMGVLFRDLKLAVEPAGSAATAALMGPLRDRLRGKRVGVLVCGSNIDLATFAQLAEV